MIRHLARMLLSGIFIAGGADALRNPGPKKPVADGVAQPIAEQIPGLPADDLENLIRINGAVQVAGGGLMALNIMPRTSALALAGTLVPTTYAAHPFWELQGEERKAQMTQFLKNAALFGALILTAMDTQGKPGVGWRAGHLVDHAATEAEFRRREAELLTQIARYKASAAASEVKAKTVAPIKQATRDARLAGGVIRRTGRVLARGAAATASGVGTGAAVAARGAGRTVKGAGKGVMAAVSAVTPG